MDHGASHEHGHSHFHGHVHEHRITSLNKAFIVGIILNLVFVLVEFGAGFYYNSMALMSDAGHNLSDVVSLVLAMLAFRLAKVKANSRYTYGYKKSTVLVSLLNAVILLIAVGAILRESIDKLRSPQEVSGGAIAWVAGIGVLINAFTAVLFLRDKDRDINVKGAYLHMAADALVSVGVLVSGLIIRATGWYMIDPVIGIVVALVILGSTWTVLSDSLRLSLDGIPRGIDPEGSDKAMLSVEGVKSVLHMPIWSLSTTENAITVHVVLDGSRPATEVKGELRHRLADNGVQHATFEMEEENEQCCCMCD